MSAPSERSERLYAMFDSYCKTVMRNASKNLKRAQANSQSHVIANSDQIQYIFDSYNHDDTYPSEYLMIYAGKFSCAVYSGMLHQVMASLPEPQRMILILDFWYGWPYGKISRYMKISTRTVYNLRQRAFKTIRSHFEEEKNNKWV